MQFLMLSLFIIIIELVGVSLLLAGSSKSCSSLKSNLYMLIIGLIFIAGGSIWLYFLSGKDNMSFIFSIILVIGTFTSGKVMGSLMYM